MIDKIKNRIAIVALAIVGVCFFYTYLKPHFDTYGDALATNPDNSVLWGFTWLTQNIGWIAVIGLAIAFLILMAWQINKDRKGR